MIDFCLNTIAILLNNCRRQTYKVKRTNQNIIFSVKCHELSDYFLKLGVEELRNHGYNAYLVKDEYGIIYPPGRRGQPQIVKTDNEPYKYDCAFWIREEFRQKLEKGEKLWIDAQYYHYYLNFLPPMSFGMLCICDDEQIYAVFVSVDTAFWEKDNRYYCRKILQFNLTTKSLNTNFKNCI